MPDDKTNPDASSRPMSVSELTRRVKRLLETEVGDVEVEGEISNWTVSARGHAYFNLKDADAIVACVFFAGSLRRAKFAPADGAKVIARGRVSVYEARGQYQLIVSALEESGVGELYKRFLELKKKLEAEGLFDPERKRPLPALPRRIGVVTSPTGAALRDIIHVIRRRFSGVELIVSPTLVQGDEAPARIIRALQRLDALRLPDPDAPGHTTGVDVIIVGRGGGSIEDLWAFNDEGVARAIAASRAPVVSAVGHETDFTIADFTADERAPTPSAAAERVVAEAAVLRDTVSGFAARMTRALAGQVENSRLKLDGLLSSWGLRQPLDLVRQAIQKLDDLSARAASAVAARATDARHRLENLCGRLDALNPERVLERGYSIVSRARDGRVVTQERQVRVGDHLRIQLSQGEIRAAALSKGDDFLEGMMEDEGEEGAPQK